MLIAQRFRPAGQKLVVEAVRAFSVTPQQNKDVKNVTFIGGGIMGGGLAQLAAQQKFSVTVVEVSEDLAQKSKKGIEGFLTKAAKKKVWGAQLPGAKPDIDEKLKEAVNQVMQYIKFSTDLGSAVKNQDLVIEAVVERLDIKHTVFKTVGDNAPEDCIICTNTSSMTLNEVFEPISKNRSRLAGLHFFNPVQMMKLVEVVHMDETSDDTRKTLLEWGKKLGKVPIESKDVPGFVVNRLLVPTMIEAVRMAERGDATPKDIDIGMKLGAGYPMGPLELSDVVGLDTVKAIIDTFRRHWPDNPLFNSSEWLDRLVKEGKLGRKTGEGFFKY
jgi:3-hydroxyacyl-CoA dehydrogenase